MSFTIYETDKKTGRFIGEVVVSSESSNPDDFSFPMRYAKTPPPVCGGGEYAVYDPNAGSWSVRKEYVPSLDEMKSRKIVGFDMEWARRLSEGYMSSFGIKVRCEALDLAMFEKGFKKASKLGKLPLLRDYEGKLHRDLPLSTIARICEELDEYMDALWTRKVLLQEMVEQAQTVEEIENITWETPISANADKIVN